MSTDRSIRILRIIARLNMRPCYPGSHSQCEIVQGFLPESSRLRKRELQRGKHDLLDYFRGHSAHIVWDAGLVIKSADPMELFNAWRSLLKLEKINFERLWEKPEIGLLNYLTYNLSQISLRIYIGES